MATRPTPALRAHFLHGFDARSLLLFAGLTLGGTQALMAQAPAPGAAAAHGPTALPAPAHASAEPTTPAPTATLNATDPRAAFGRADANGDGKVTLREAERFPAVAERFSTFDSDRNGSLSPEEFARSIAKP